MITKYITKKFELVGEKPDDHSLKVYLLQEDNENVYLELAPLSAYFESQVRQMANKLWKEKQIWISYNEKIKVGFFNFKAFVKIVYPDV